MLSYLEKNKNSDTSYFNDNNEQIINAINGHIISDNYIQEYKYTLCSSIFQNKMTELINNEIFEKDVQNLRTLFMDTFNKCLNEYKTLFNLKLEDIRFVYKGEITMQLLYNKYSDIINTTSIAKLLKFTKNNFDRCSYDYSIHINPNLNNYHIHAINLNILTLKCLDEIRDKMDIEFNNDMTVQLMRLKISQLNNTLNDVKQENKNDDIYQDLQNINRFIGISWGDNIFGDVKLDDNLDATFGNILQNQEYLQTNKLNPKRFDFLLTLDKNKNKYMINISENKQNIYLSVSDVSKESTVHKIKNNIILYFKTKDNKIGYMNCPSEIIRIDILKNNNYDNLCFDNYIVDDLNYIGYSVKGFITFVSNNLSICNYKYAKKLLFYMLLEIILTNNFDELYMLFKDILNGNLENISRFNNMTLILILQKADKQLLEYLNKHICNFENKEVVQIGKNYAGNATLRLAGKIIKSKINFKFSDGKIIVK